MEMARRTAPTEEPHEAKAKVELARDRSLGTRNSTSVTLLGELGQPACAPAQRSRRLWVLRSEGRWRQE